MRTQLGRKISDAVDVRDAEEAKFAQESAPMCQRPGDRWSLEDLKAWV